MMKDNRGKTFTEDLNFQGQLQYLHQGQLKYLNQGQQLRSVGTELLLFTLLDLLYTT